MALVSVLARDNHWARRQTFVLLCGALQSEEGGLAVLTSKLLAPLLLLADDPVPNVRLSLASLLHSEAGQSLEGWSEVLARYEYFTQTLGISGKYAQESIEKYGTFYCDLP